MFGRIPYTQEASPLFFEAPNYQTTMHRTRNPSPLLYLSENVKEIISGARVYLFIFFYQQIIVYWLISFQLIISFLTQYIEFLSK